MSDKISRRQFLYGSALAAAGVGLAACAKQEPTAVPAKPAAPTEKPAEPTNTPRPTNTPIPTKEPPTPVPTVAAPVKEAPELAAMVEAGELPSLEERLPKNPLVLSPLHGIGKYGGTIRSFHASLGVQWEESQYGHSALRWVDDGLGIQPGMCESYETNADNTEWTVHFREGLKWSDGADCTVDDVMFWWEDLVLYQDFSDNPPDFGQAGGEVAEFIKIDDYTLKMKYSVPAPLTAKRLAMWVNSAVGPRWIAPKHYLMQFHPTYNSDVTTVEDLEQKIMYRQNPECPALAAWVPETFEAGKRRVWKRNPYYYCVDTEGNQLPYIDGIDEQAIEDKEVQMLTIRQGDVDYLAHIHHKGSLEDISALKAAEADGDYKVVLLDSGGGSGQYYFCNYDTPDDKKRELYRNPKFKAALCYCMDRETIQKVRFFGTGELTTGTHSPKCLEFNFNDEARQWYAKERDSYIEFRIDWAQELLDELGLVDADGDGFRDYPDGSKLEIRIDFASDASQSFLDSHELCVKNFEAAGLRTITNQITPSEFGGFWRSGQGEIRGNWGIGDGPDHLVYPSWLVPNEPNRWAPLCGNRYMLQGTPKEDTELDVSPWDRTPPRWASTEEGFLNGPAPKMQQILTDALLEPDAIKRMEMVWELLQIHIDEGKFGIGSVANTPSIYVVSNKLMNVPFREDLATGGFCGPWIVPHPALHNPETFAFK